MLISYDQANNDMLPLSSNAAPDATPEKDPDRLDFGANIGFLVNFFSGNLKVSGEYYYNGEETELKSLGTQFPLFWGNNFAAGISFKWDNGKNRVNSILLYNTNENSGVIIPSLSIEPEQFLKLTFSIPIILGSDTGGYAQNNPDPSGRQFSFVVMASLNGSI